MHGDPMSAAFDPGDEAPVYIISVAAQLAGLHPQTLRTYDRMGLVSPGQPAGQGRQRRYSLRDVLALREVQRLSQEDGVNLSGIKRILELDRELRRHQQHLADMTAELTQLRMELESTRAVAARLACCAAAPAADSWSRCTAPAARRPARAARRHRSSSVSCPRPRAIRNSTPTGSLEIQKYRYGRQAHS